MANCAGSAATAVLADCSASQVGQVAEEMVNSVNSVAMLEHLSCWLVATMAQIGQGEVAAAKVDRICPSAPESGLGSWECVETFVCAVGNGL